LFGFEQEKASALPVFDDIAERIYHCCFHKEWFIKAGGCCGISHLMHRLSITWIRRHYFEFIEALFYLLKVLLIIIVSILIVHFRPLRSVARANQSLDEC
jgi:hypothetical protein